jgi:hypothetical protein
MKAQGKSKRTQRAEEACGVSVGSAERTRNEVSGALIYNLRFGQAR